MLSASIVAFHTDSDELARCLSMLSDKIFDTVYVVDNSSSEATKQVCGGFSHVEYIPTTNVGYGAGHNIALRKSLNLGVDYHVVMNSDLRFDPSELTGLIEYMNAGEDVGALQPKIVNPDGTLQYTVRALPTPFDLFVRRFVPQSRFAKRRDRYELRHIDHDCPFDVPYHQGSFMLLRCSALKRVGLFDEHFFMYPEDIDLTRRIHVFYRTMFHPGMTVVHDHRAASYHSWKMTVVHIVNMIRYFNKWGWFYDKERRELNRRLFENS